MADDEHVMKDTNKKSIYDKRGKTTGFSEEYVAV